MNILKIKKHENHIIMYEVMSRELSSIGGTLHYIYRGPEFEF
jgi:hypothetical protein